MLSDEIRYRQELGWKYETHKFEKMKVQSSMDVALHSPVLREHQDYIYNRLEYTLKAYVWANPKSAAIEYPKDWWQSFKDRWFPVWAKKRWPVKMRHVDIREIFPFLNIDTPEYESRLVQVWSER